MLTRLSQTKNRPKSMKDVPLDGDSNKIRIPGIEKGDINFLAKSSQKMKQREILSTHVKNWKELDLKNRRKVVSHIQAKRAMHAKEVFLKELAAVGKTLNN